MYAGIFRTHHSVISHRCFGWTVSMPWISGMHSNSTADKPWGWSATSSRVPNLMRLFGFWQLSTLYLFRWGFPRFHLTSLGEAFTALAKTANMPEAYVGWWLAVAHTCCFLHLFCAGIYACLTGGACSLFRSLHSWNHETGLDLHWLESMRKHQRTLKLRTWFNETFFHLGKSRGWHADGTDARRAPVAAAWRHAWGPSQQTFFVWVAWEVIDSFATSFLRLRKSFLFPDCETLHLRGSTSAIWSWFSSFYFLGWTPWIGARFSPTVTAQCSTLGVWFWPRP